ncbi:hypothetical protein BBP40_008200 [Aspergillus hancockii]|nr:hypothetical protein BBP40_008200 [Aspergillus hancockii]
MTNRGTAYILYNDPADAEAAIAHMHEAQLDEEALVAKDISPPTVVILAPPHTHPDRLPLQEGLVAPGPWKDMISIAHGLYLDLDHHIALDHFHQNADRHPHRGGGDRYARAVPGAAGAAVPATAVTMTTAATVTEVEVQAEAGLMFDTASQDGE